MEGGRGERRKLNRGTEITNRKDTIRISIRAHKASALSKESKVITPRIKFAVLNGSFQFRFPENFWIRGGLGEVSAPLAGGGRN